MAIAKFEDLDLRRLASLSGSDRAFLSVYCSGRVGRLQLEKKLRQSRALLQDQPDEAEYFNRNVALLNEQLPADAEHVAAFICWAVDLADVFVLPVAVPNVVRIDSSPYIRSLAEMIDEYESYAVVVADNSKAEVFLVSSASAEDAVSISGNIKNNVRVGGWSQQRYKRRRDKQLREYAEDIVGALVALDRENEFRRVLMVGSKETLRAIREVLPAQIAGKATTDKAVDLGKPGEYVDRALFDLFAAQERRSEKALWETIKNEYLRGGLAAVGIDAVLEAAQAGRVDQAVVDRGYHPVGRRCRSCGWLGVADAASPCPKCKNASLFEVDLVNECVEFMAQTGAGVDFADPIGCLTEMGRIGALLRY